MDQDGLADDTFVAAAPAVVAAVVRDARRWRLWWPDLELRVDQDRGVEGVRWLVSGGATGTAEIWLEAVGDGTVVHFYLRVPLGDRDRRRRALAWKRVVHHLKDQLEAGRAPGTPARPALVAQGDDPNGR